MTLFCPVCGIDNLRPEARFCDQCGADLTRPADDKSVVDSERKAGGDDHTAVIPALREDSDISDAKSEVAHKRDDATYSIPEAQLLRQGTASGAETESVNIRVAGSSGTEEEQGDVTGVLPMTSTAPERSQRAGLPRSNDLQAGYVLYERYHILEMLGKGGFGAVYLAQDIKLDRQCVVKQMLIPHKLPPHRLEIQRTNFEREARLLVQLNHPGHPNIPEIYDHFVEGEGNYLVMKYIEGRDLRTVMEQNGGPLPVNETMRHAVALSSALHYIHTHGDEPVIHRDIKPTNILLGNDDRVWLVDFGLAKAQPAGDSTDSVVTKASGSVGYTPLEQWLGEPVTASDIYAFGTTLHHLLSGLSPVEAYGKKFNIVKLQQLHAQFIPLCKLNSQIPKTLECIVASATGADPEQRPTALQLQQQLNVFLAGAKGAPLFTFKSGETAMTKAELVDLCEKHRREAQGYLYREEFENWFRLINRNDLAEAASQAVKQGKNQQDALEKFLKMIFPNLFVRRLRRAVWRMGLLFLQFGLSAIVIIVLLALLGSFIARFILQDVISRQPWDFESLQDSYTEVDLNNIAESNFGSVFDQILVDLRPCAPEASETCLPQVDISANWNGVLFFTTLEQTPDSPSHFRLTNFNGLPFSFFPANIIGRNLSQGVNAGFDAALEKAGLAITDLTMTGADVVFAGGNVFGVDSVSLDIDRADRPESAAPIATPLAQPSATPDKVTRFIVFNRSDLDMILKITGPAVTQTQLVAHSRREIRTEPGVYTYTVTAMDGTLLLQNRITLTQRLATLDIVP